jgi:hypothetical protein
MHFRLPVVVARTKKWIFDQQSFVVDGWWVPCLFRQRSYRG